MRLSYKRSDIFEAIAEAVIRFGFGALLLLSSAYVLWMYRGEGYTSGLILVLFVGGLALFGRAVWTALRVRHVRLYKVRCPYCEELAELTAPPTEDFSCSTCHRMVPVKDGAVLQVHEVRCGYCNSVNYYSLKTELLLCEECNREIPISAAEGADGTRRIIPKGFARTDDDQLYELVLVSNGGHKTEELIDTLQHMLALNRGQVKQMLEEMPLTVLSGITRRKAEMLQAQLSLKDATAEFKPIKQ